MTFGRRPQGWSKSLAISVPHHTGLYDVVLFFSKEKGGEKRKRYGEGEERGERGARITPPPSPPL